MVGRRIIRYRVKQEFSVENVVLIIIIFLLLSHLIWGRRNTSSSSTVLYSPSWHHSLLSLTFVTQPIQLFFGLPLPLCPSTFILITVLVTCVSCLLITCPYQRRLDITDMWKKNIVWKSGLIIQYMYRISNTSSARVVINVWVGTSHILCVR